MLPLPKFKRNLREYSILEFFHGSGYLRKTVREMAKRYLSLGGDSSLSLDAKEPMSLITLLEQNIDSMLMEELRPSECESITDPGRDTGNWIQIELKHHYSPVVLHSVSAVVTLNYWFSTSINFMKEIREKRPEVHSFVSSLLSVLARCNYSPVSTEHSIIDRFEAYDYFHDADDEIINETRRNQREFRRIIPDAKRLRISKDNLCGSYRKLKHHFNPKERIWIKNVLRLFSLSLKLGERIPSMDYERTEAIYSEYSETLPVEEFFTIVWDEGSCIAESWFEMINSNAGESGPPVIIFDIGSKQDAGKIREFIEFLHLMQVIFYDGSVWYGQSNTGPYP